MKKPTKEQQRALKALWERSHPEGQSYLRFRRNAYWELAGPALMVPWAGMIIGIEPDGYTHS